MNANITTTPMTLAKATETQRLALQFWASGAANKKAGREAQEEARRRLHQTLFPSDSAAVLESKRVDETGKAPRRRLVHLTP